MARPTLTRHWKFGRLTRLLGSAALARGVLELLWEPCYDRGDPDVGDASDIAFSVGWPAEDAARLVSALLDCRFIDARGDGRYDVHDLMDHAPQYVQTRSKREHERRAPKTCAECGTAYHSEQSHSKFCSSVCRKRAYRRMHGTDGTQGTLRDDSPPVSAPPVSAPPVSAHTTAPASRRVSLPTSAPDAPDGAACVWHLWQDVGAEHGYREHHVASPKALMACNQAAALAPLDDLTAALRAWWASPHVTSRNLGLFVSQLPEVLAHLRTHPDRPFRAPPSSDPESLSDYVAKQKARLHQQLAARGSA